jgi:hypothetical protein
LQLYSTPGVTAPDQEAAEQKQLQREEESTKQCLSICNQVSEHVDQIRTNPAKSIFADTLDEIKGRLTKTTSELEGYLQRIENRLYILKAQETVLSNKDTSERERIQKEKASIIQSLTIAAEVAEQVTKAQESTFDNITAAEDSYQVTVSTIGDLISAKRVTAGHRSMSFLGQISDVALQQLAQDRGVSHMAMDEPKVTQKS